jgi:hypothetical protein
VKLVHLVGFIIKKNGLKVLMTGWNDEFLWLSTAGNFWGMPSQSGNLSSSLHALSRTLFASRRLAF